MAATKLPFTTRLQTRDGSSTTKDARITNLLIEQVGEDEIHFIKRPGFSLFDGAVWSSAAALGSMTMPDGTMISFTGSPTGGTNNATYHFSWKAGYYAVFNPVEKSTHIALSNGNLTATSDSGAVWQGVKTVLYKSTGKLYCEYTVTTFTVNSTLGIVNSTGTVAGQMGSTAGEYAYHAGGYKYHNNTLTAYGATYTDGDKISVVFDADAGSLSFWKNGADQGVAYTGITGSWATGFAVDLASKVVTVNMGASAFAYTPPAGYTGWQA